ncbi:Arylsulfatase [Caulifigura coniformis]|uniref:Arylsulfatase n=1 Tax=Caulifigura coniformis TaxID=2527983 RepID=A0A517SFR5_9PLAN|nr:arylsulfatase [Caulifigura coniformis]QDT54962.1 Arylsulfatase [Caulifigura coniformis]
MRSIVWCVAVLGMALSAGAADRPNIILIMSDDMGWSDLGCYGGEIQTPQLDALAAGGVRFTQFYNTARCCPTRACLLTGVYPHQAGIGHMMDERNLPGYRGDLNKHTPTIAEALKPAGYGTYQVGKWHVTRHVQDNGPKHNWPQQRGFDRNYSMITGAGSFFDPWTLVRDNTTISPVADPDYTPETYYFTDAISDHAVRYIADHTREQGDKPFFMYVAYTAAHWPMHALPEDIAKYKGKYDAGYAPFREARLKKSISLGLIGDGEKLSPQAEDWSKVDNQAWEAAGMEVYAAMIDRMDQGIGKIVDELKRTKQFDNTLVMFLQDNGACAELMGRTGNMKHPDIPRPDKPTLPAMKPTDFHSGIVPDQTRDGYPVRMGKNAWPGGPDTYVAYGRGWANVSNTPFREYKHWVHEGGISSPLIMHWPARVDAEHRGKVYKEAGHLIDLMATCVDVAKARFPALNHGEKTVPLEGVSLAPALNLTSLKRSKPLYWEHEGNRAVRLGTWKVVAKGKEGPWELYDIEHDRVESRNLAGKHPERVKELAGYWDVWAERALVKPWPWDAADPGAPVRPNQNRNRRRAN